MGKRGGVLLILSLAALPLVACSDDDGTGGGGDTVAFCDGLESLDRAGADLAEEESLERLQGLDPPADIAADWNFFVGVMVGGELPAGTDQDEAEEAFLRVSEYLNGECGLDINR
ncbi:MAG: hypothetical protein ACRD0U_13475 [Acidimicrobiales bacterium]